MKNMSGEDDKQASRTFLDAVERLIPRLKEANLKDPDECETFLRRIDAELPEGHPKIFDTLVEAYWSGSPLLYLFQNALKMVSERGDLNEADKEMAMSDAEEFWALFNGFREAQHVPRGLVFQFASLALLTGLQAGLSSEEVRKLCAGLPAELGAQGGKMSGEARRQRIQWKTYVANKAPSLRSKNPTLSQEDLADKIIQKATKEKIEIVGRRQVVEYLSELERTGQLPRRSGSPRKRSG